MGLSGNAAEEGLQDKVVRRLLTTLVARKKLRTETFARTRHAQPAEYAELGHQIAKVKPIAKVQARKRGMFVDAEVQIAIPLHQQGFLDQALELPADHLG